jgi:hypothetical protein
MRRGTVRQVGYNLSDHINGWLLVQNQTQRLFGSIDLKANIACVDVDDKLNWDASLYLPIGGLLIRSKHVEFDALAFSGRFWLSSCGKDVRFGSLADIITALRMFALPPKADIGRYEP